MYVKFCGFAIYMLLDFPYLSRVAECVRCSTIFYVGAGETSVFGVAAESAMWLVLKFCFGYSHIFFTFFSAVYSYVSYFIISTCS